MNSLGIAWQINIGQLFEIAALLGGYLIIGVTMGSRVVAIEKEVKKLSYVITALAVQHTRIDRLEEDLREMRHGKGFVVER